MSALSVITGVLTFVLLVIIAVGIMNTLWIAIRERTREIGTLRAIGMQRARVLVMFLTEALMLSLAGDRPGRPGGARRVCLLINAADISARPRSSRCCC